MSSNSIFFLNIKPELLFHSKVTGFFSVNNLLPVTFQIVLLFGNFNLFKLLAAHPVSIK